MTILTTSEAPNSGVDGVGILDVNDKSGYNGEGDSKEVGSKISSKSNKTKRTKRKNKKNFDPNDSSSIVTIRRDELESLVSRLVKEGE